jgi:predicted DNA-binding transcriptional regulator AlpA
VPFTRSLLSATHFCDHCQQETQFLPLHSAIVLAGVSRSTMYYWMERRWIHWRESPSGRRLICEASLSRPMREPLALSLEGCGYHQGPGGQPEPVRPAQKQSESVRKCPKPSNPVG